MRLSPGLPRATRVLPAMDERMAHIEEATPVLVELVERVSDSLEPLGRLADRVPGARR